MVVAYVTTHTPFRRQLEVLSHTVEYCSRELRVESHEVCTNTPHAIGTLIAVAYGEISLGRRTAIQQDVLSGRGIEVYQTYLMTNGIVRHVDDSHLPALLTFIGMIQQAYLYAIE